MKIFFQKVVQIKKLYPIFESQTDISYYQYPNSYQEESAPQSADFFFVRFDLRSTTNRF